VLGSPIAHSLSPLIHRAGYAAAGLTRWRYDAIECVEAALSGFVAGLGAPWAGLSITMPLKEAALALAGSASAAATAVGAANTLVRGPAGWHAENTDITGMTNILRTAGLAAGASVTVLGAGGTARAALAAAAAIGADRVTVLARRAAAVDALQPVAERLGITVVGVDFAEAARHCAVDLVVSTVPRGVADAVAASATWGDTLLLDALYDPWPTPLAAAAAANGCTVLAGLDLLLAQAVEQFTLFTGVPAPQEQMRAALAAAVPAWLISA